ncbi:SDR family oxidoreductase [Actinokineospora sp. UTMC 2448]|uniref:SDR family oxidoreductase n=1 Tax=Actinokineospora sp. UTMC 2448 TaxID=2268449 RepID=UPI00216484BB|nr:SDR family oxidoreductase [Actinokineospora sp. UTMC 2448]UVS80379.1 NAD(P)H azoreductase [Actinokineospora sp. UTMC 2448]
MTRTLLITGATGSVSTALLAELEGSDLHIRALVRDPTRATLPPGVEIATGDLDDPRSLTGAFDGVDDLWLLVPNGPRAPENSSNALWAARQAGVERVVRLSAVGAAHDAPTRSGRLHALSDHEVAACGMNWTILRPHWFMQNLLNDAPGIATHGTFSSNAAAARLGMIDVRDIARFAARILTDTPTQHHGMTYTPTGPRPVSFTEIARLLTEILGKPVEYHPVSDEDHRKTLLSHGMPWWIADMLIEYSQAYARGWGDYTTNDYQNVVGHPPRDVKDFLHDHAGAFA